MTRNLVLFFALMGSIGGAQAPQVQTLAPALVVSHTVLNPPALAGGVVAYPKGESLVAFDLASRQVLWRKPKGSYALFAARQELVFTADRTGTVRAWESRSGKQVWALPGMGEPRVLAAAELLVVIAKPGPPGKNASGLDPLTGSLRWQTGLVVPAEAQLEVGTGFISYKGQTSFDAPGSPARYVLDIATGEKHSDPVFFTQRTGSGRQFVDLSTSAGGFITFNDPARYTVHITVHNTDPAETLAQDLGEFTLGPRPGCDPNQFGDDLGWVGPLFLSADDRFVWALVGDVCGNRIAQISRQERKVAFTDIPEALSVQERVRLSKSTPAFMARRGYGLATQVPAQQWAARGPGSGAGLRGRLRRH